MLTVYLCKNNSLCLIELATETGNHYTKKTFLRLLEKSTNCFTSSQCPHTKYQISSPSDAIIRECRTYECCSVYKPALDLQRTVNPHAVLFMFHAIWALDPRFPNFLYIQSYGWTWFTTWALDPQFPVFFSPILTLSVLSPVSPGPTISSFLIQFYLWVFFSPASPGPMIQVFLSNPTSDCSFPTWALDPWFKFSYPNLPLICLPTWALVSSFLIQSWLWVCFGQMSPGHMRSNILNFYPNMSQSLLLTHGLGSESARYYNQSCAYLC